MAGPSPAVQDYLKAIYRLGEQADGDAPVTVSGIAEAIDVSVPSASNMLGRLESMGYIRSRSGGRRPAIELTEEGRGAALTVLRHHRLLETYLATRLGMAWDEVHREAEILEHHISETLADRMADALGHPERDPHGDPIPTAQGDVESVPSALLVDLAVGQIATISRVSDRDSGLLRYLAARGLVPDAAIEVVAIEPFGGPLSVRVGASDPVDVPPDAARAVHVAAGTERLVLDEVDRDVAVDEAGLPPAS